MENWNGKIREGSTLDREQRGAGMEFSSKKSEVFYFIGITQRV